VSRLPTLLLLALSTLALQAQPRIYPNGAVNAASFLSPATPGGALAQGSIFSIFGQDLAPEALEAQAFPLATTLGGVQALILTATGENFAAPLLYVSANQINAILPSFVPVGRHLLRIQRDGVQSNDQPIKVVEASLGLFFFQEQGVPVAAGHVVTQFFSRRVTLETPVRPGDTVVLWGSGLGPVAGPDDQPPPATASAAQIEVLLAGAPVAHSYAGRSACCAGLDQINIEIPRDSPTGCVVPLVVRVNGNLSNHVALPITADGAPCDPHLGFRAGRLNLVRQWTEDVPADRASALFDQPPGELDPARLPPEGACMVWRPASGGGRWFDTTDFVNLPANDAGEAISLTTPSATLELTGGAYSTLNPPSENFLGPGVYAASASGGDSFPPFEAALQVNPAPVPEVLDPKDVSARSLPAALRWFGGDPAAIGVLWSEGVVCRTSVAEGQFQVPPYVWANQQSGARLFAFGAVQSAGLMTPTDGPDHGLLVYREEFLQQGDLGAPHLASTPVTLPSGEKIQAELAATASERARGLMFRPVLPPDKGMLFLFEAPGRFSFWMLNTLVPLDILWLDSDREILFISADTPPCQTQVCPTYGPSAAAQYVLEIAAGEAARRGLDLGDRVAW
jgi:hypothetical protein